MGLQVFAVVDVRGRDADDQGQSVRVRQDMRLGARLGPVTRGSDMCVCPFLARMSRVEDHDLGWSTQPDAPGDPAGTDAASPGRGSRVVAANHIRRVTLGTFTPSSLASQDLQRVQLARPRPLMPDQNRARVCRSVTRSREMLLWGNLHVRVHANCSPTLLP